MFKIKNNKGFSMVEILAVVVILGVISTIGIVTITKLVDNSRIHYYQTQEEQLVLAAQSYANDNKNILPKTVGEMRIITLKELRENNYIKEEIVDQNKNKCYEEKHKEKDKNGNEVELEGSRVEVYKSTKTDYIYTGYLECDACVKFQEKDDGNIAPTSCYTSKTKGEPSIKISFPNVTNESPLNENDVVQIEIKGTEGNENIKVASYSYKIYVNNIQKKNSGLKINNKQHLVKIDDNKLFNYIPGKVKVVVTATNSEGISKTVAASKDLTKLLSPACGRITYENVNAMKNYNYTSTGSISCGTTDYPWLNRNSPNKTRQAWVLCNENYKLGCAQHEFSVNMTAEGENEAVTIKDKNGQNQTCIIKKCMDYTNPTCTLNVTGTQSPHSGYYYGDKVSISFASKSDSLSGLDAYDATGSSTASYNKNNSVPSSSITQGEKTYYGHVRDKAKNTNSCNKKITTTFKHKITFNANGGTASLASKDQYWKDPIGTLPTATRSGYIFNGWFTAASGGTKISTNTLMPASNVTYYAHWTSPCATVKYVNGTTCSKPCDGGTYNRLAYSTVNNARCPSKDLPSGGSRCNTSKCTVKCYVKFDGTPSGYNNGWYRTGGTIKLIVDTKGNISAQGLKKQNSLLNSATSSIAFRIDSEQAVSKYQGYVRLSNGNVDHCTLSVGLDKTKPKVSKVYGNHTYCVKSSSTTNHPSDGYTYVGQWSFWAGDKLSGLHYVKNVTCKTGQGGNDCSSCSSSNANCRVTKGNINYKYQLEGVWWRRNYKYHYYKIIDNAGNDFVLKSTYSTATLSGNGGFHCPLIPNGTLNSDFGSCPSSKRKNNNHTCMN